MPTDSLASTERQQEGPKCHLLFVIICVQEQLDWGHQVISPKRMNCHQIGQSLSHKGPKIKQVPLVPINSQDLTTGMTQTLQLVQNVRYIYLLRRYKPIIMQRGTGFRFQVRLSPFLKKS